MKRTNIVIDDDLMRDAMEVAGTTTMRDTVAFALRELVEREKRVSILDLRGQGRHSADRGDQAGRGRPRLVVVDTTVWVDLLRGNATPHVGRLEELLRSHAPVTLTDIVFMELLQGARDDRQEALISRRFQGFPILRLETLDDFARAARLNRAARDAGVSLRNRLDFLIAAVCVRESAEILHSDSDFDRLASCTELRVLSVRDRRPRPPLPPGRR